MATDHHAPASVFDRHRCLPEIILPIPARRAGDQPLAIGIAAAGGGRIGHAYANNDWLYEIRLGPALLCAGTDLHSGATPATHHQMAVLLATALADSDDLPEPLLPHRDRLACWAADNSDDNHAARAA